MPYYKRTYLCLSLLVMPLVAQAKPVVIDQVVASVDGSVILDSELEQEKANVAKTLAAENRTAEMDQPVAFKKRVLAQMIEDKLLDKEIKRLGLEATDAQVEKIIQNIMKENNVASKSDFERLLKREGLSFTEFENNYRKRISRNNYIRQNIQPKIKISPEDIQKEIARLDPDREMKKKFFEFSMLFVPTSTMSNQAFADLATQIKNGKPFEDIAKKHTLGPNKEKGGYMGKVNQDDLHQNIQAALAKTPKGEVSEVIAMDGGNALVKKISEGMQLDDLSEEETARYTEQLFNQRITEALNLNINRLKQNALTKIYL